jgi:hypothetical protein
MKKHQFLRIAILLVLFLIEACTDQDQTIAPEQLNIEVVLLTDNDHLRTLVSLFNQEATINGRSSSILAEVDFERAIKKHNAQTGNTHYSFSMHSDDGLIVRKFILSENSEGEITGHIFEYEVDAGWLSEIEEFPGWDQYNGFFRILDLAGTVIAENRMIAGSSVNTDKKSGRGSGASCVTYTQLIGYICVGGSCTPKYETITTCFSADGGSGGNETSQGGDTEGVGVEMGPTDMPIDGNGGGGGGSSFNSAEIERLAGDKPLKEYPDKCTGIQDMWDAYPDKEVAGYLTADGQVILTNELDLSGGLMSGVYTFQGTSYYPSNEQPANSYQGMETTKSKPVYYLIPVVASIHTHTPCRSDGSDGVSHAVGSKDKKVASTNPAIAHWVIGCGAVAQYSGGQSDFFNKSTGELSSICEHVN